MKLNLGLTIVEVLKRGTDESTEHYLAALFAFLSGLNNAIQEPYKDPQLGLKDYLQDLMNNQTLERNDCIVEKEYCRLLLKQLFVSNIPSEEAADR